MIWGFARCVPNGFCPRSVLQADKKLEGARHLLPSVLLPDHINITLIIVLHSRSSNWSPAGSSYRFVCFPPTLPEQPHCALKEIWVPAGWRGLLRSASQLCGFASLFSQLNSYLNSWGNSDRLCLRLRGLCTSCGVFPLNFSATTDQTPQMSGSKVCSPSPSKIRNSVKPSSPLCYHSPEGGNCFL